MSQAYVTPSPPRVAPLRFARAEATAVRDRAPRDALHPGEPLHIHEALSAYGVDADHVKIQQAVRKLRRRHGLIMSGKPREPGYRLRDWWWVPKRVRGSLRSG